MKTHKTIYDFWDSVKDTRLGQLYGLLALGFIFGLIGSLQSSSMTIKERVIGFLVVGPSMGIMLVLILLVPSIWFEQIKKNKKTGKSVVLSRILIALYFFPLLPVIMLGSIALIMNEFMD